MGKTFMNCIVKFLVGWKSGRVVSKLEMQLEECGFESNLTLDGDGVKAMPGSIPAPNPGSFSNWKERKYRWPNGSHRKNIFLISYTLDAIFNLYWGENRKYLRIFSPNLFLVYVCYSVDFI